MSQRRLILPLVLQLGLTGCAAAAPFPASLPGAPAQVAALAVAPRIVVRIAPRAFQLQADSPGRLATDVMAYRVYLSAKAGATYTAVSDQLVVASGASNVTFADLDKTKTYRVGVMAYGDAAGSEAEALGDFMAYSDDVDMTTLAAGQDAVVSVKPDLDLAYSSTIGLSMGAIFTDSRCTVSTLGSVAGQTVVGDVTYPVYEYVVRAVCPASGSSGGLSGGFGGGSGSIGGSSGSSGGSSGGTNYSSYVTTYTSTGAAQVIGRAAPAGGFEVAYGPYGG